MLMANLTYWRRLRQPTFIGLNGWFLCRLQGCWQGQGHFKVWIKACWRHITWCFDGFTLVIPTTTGKVSYQQLLKGIMYFWPQRPQLTPKVGSSVIQSPLIRHRGATLNSWCNSNKKILLFPQVFAYRNEVWPLLTSEVTEADFNMWRIIPTPWRVTKISQNSCKLWP